jgi:hypothetical protein
MFARPQIGASPMLTTTVTTIGGAASVMTALPVATVLEFRFGSVEIRTTRIVRQIPTGQQATRQGNRAI